LRPKLTFCEFLQHIRRAFKPITLPCRRRGFPLRGRPGKEPSQKLLTISPMARDASGKSLTLSVYETLRADVLSCKLLPGTKLRISEITARFDVANGAVREALSRLVADGLVDALDQRGFRVSAMTMEDLLDLTQTRIEIDSIALRKAIVRGSEPWESTIRACYEELRQTTPPHVHAGSDLSRNWQSLHRAYHQSLLAACGSEWLLHFHGRLSEQAQRFQSLSVEYSISERDFDGEHREIMGATLDRDADTAVRLLSEHYRTTAGIIANAQIVASRDSEPHAN
jgi:DNA-binding GntR family transcriptional regulator